MIIVPDELEAEDIMASIQANVLRVFDGDGFMASVWHPIRGEWLARIPFRFAFIDAPEMEQPFGVESKEFLAGLIAGKKLRLSLIGKESTGGLPIDPYKRMLCMGFLTEQMQIGELSYFLAGKCQTGMVKKARPTVRNVELEMIINGWAWVVEQYAFEREKEYFAAQDDARRNRRGLWAMDDPEPPWNFKQKQKRRKRAEQRQPNLFSNMKTIQPKPTPKEPPC